jgi:Zn-dependent protease with chaperone function
MDAIYYDGLTSKRNGVFLTLEQGGIRIGDLAFWQAENTLIAVENPLRLMQIDSPARLDVKDGGVARAILTTYNLKKQSQQHERKNTAKILMWSGLAVASTLLFLVFGLPILSRTLAPLVPQSVDIKLGEAIDKEVVKMFGNGQTVKTCTNEAGVNALNKLIAKLETEAGYPTKLKVKMLDMRMVNAFATSGGYVYLMDGLLQKAESPDQLAGVIAHEIGHLYHRHVLQNFIEAGGVGLLLGQIFGDFSGSTAILYATRQIISSAHSRGFETESDKYGVQLMHKAKGDPRALATMLEKIDPSKSKDSPLDWLRSHPVTEGRAALIRKEAGDVPLRAPILNGQEWLDLRDICKSTEIPVKKPDIRL